MSGLKQRLIDLLTQAAQEAQKQGKLPEITLPEIAIEHPQNPDHGDYASSLPLKLARATRMNPLKIAQELAALVAPTPEIGSVTVAPPGFINFTLNKAWLTGQVTGILQAGDRYGNTEQGKGSRVQIEFVSVNPTGPLHVGHGRGAVLGSALANTLKAAGYDITTEYYINDAGNQVETFRRSLYARYQQQMGKDVPIPEDGYVGSYMVDLAKEVIAEHGDALRDVPEKELVTRLGEIGLPRMLARIKTDLELLSVTFDSWFSEKSLYDKGQYQKVLSLLEASGYIAKRESATWFVSTALGEDKDNVVVRTDGTATYFATDIAYHYNKFIERKFDRVIDIWGADHMGHVSRMKAVVGALGIDPERLKIIISQMVTLRSGGEVVRLSKRSGDIITLRELIEDVGADVCRYFFLSRAADSQMDFDLQLAKKQSVDNPVYYIQYAHARIASILRLAAEKHLDSSGADLALLTTPAELTLIRKMLLLPEIIETIACTLEPHHLTYYALELATVFHGFYKDCRVVTEDAALTKARLKLVDAARIVLNRTLHMMGMAAPDTM
ncbi:MAG: arginine--tRNA ligase [Dehalococcoidales bacterium]|nr:arginine--tRNA ligase [Dehalococcoidales bacterium]